MTLESKLKKDMLTTAIDLIIKEANKSPERCIRNLIGLGEKACPNILTKQQVKELQINLLTLYKNHEISKIKDSFLLAYNLTN